MYSEFRGLLPAPTPEIDTYFVGVGIVGGVVSVPIETTAGYLLAVR